MTGLNHEFSLQVAQANQKDRRCHEHDVCVRLVAYCAVLAKTNKRFVREEKANEHRDERTNYNYAASL